MYKLSPQKVSVIGTKVGSVIFPQLNKIINLLSSLVTVSFLFFQPIVVNVFGPSLNKLFMPTMLSQMNIFKMKSCTIYR
jgi:hypothetical protein